MFTIPYNELAVSNSRNKNSQFLSNTKWKWGSKRSPVYWQTKQKV